MLMFKKIAIAGLAILLVTALLLFAGCGQTISPTVTEPPSTSVEAQSTATAAGFASETTLSDTSKESPVYTQTSVYFPSNDASVGNSLYCIEGSKVVKYALDDLHSEVIFQTKKSVVQVALLNENSLAIAIAEPSFDGQPRTYHVLDLDTGKLSPLELEGIEDAVQVRLFALEDKLMYDVFKGEGMDSFIYRRMPNGETTRAAIGSIDYLYNNKIYYFTYPNNDIGQLKNAFRCNFDGSEVEFLGVLKNNQLVFDDLRVVLDENVNRVMYCDGEYVYCTSTTGLYQVNMRGGQKKQLTDQVVNDLLVADGWIYFHANGTLQKQKIA